MRNALFIAFLLVALAYALRRGGGPERAMAGIAAALVISDQMLHLMVPPEFDGLDTGHLAIDLVGASATILLAMTAHRFWPMIVAVLHIFPLLAHLSKALEVPMHPIAYLTMQVAVSWFVPPLLIFGTWRHQRRLATNGSDPSWHGSFPRWIRKAAKR